MLMLPNGRYVAFVEIPLSCFSLEYSCLQWYAVKTKKKILESKLNTFTG